MCRNPPVLSAAGALAFGAEGLIFFSRRAVLPSDHGPRTRVGRAAIGSDSNLDAQKWSTIGEHARALGDGNGLQPDDAAEEKAGKPAAAFPKPSAPATGWKRSVGNE
jgi:hypothetical protein